MRYFVIFLLATVGLRAAATIKATDDQWLSVGLGFRSSFNAVENAAPSGQAYSNNFAVNNARLYFNGQVQKYVKFEFNTDCVNCAVAGGGGTFANGTQNVSGNSSMGLLDAIAKFEFHEAANVWFGRMLLPSERGELSGPFYTATFDGFRTPLFPADYSANFNGASAAGGGAGLYGRDNAATFWGKVHPFGTHILYVASISQGLRGPANQNNNLMYTGRLQWNLLNDETGPGYYMAGTYYGAAGDILAIGGSAQYQKDGAGTAGNSADFKGTSVDILFEKVLPNNIGVFTFNGEFKRFWAEYGSAAFAAATPACFCVFSGTSWTVTTLYVIPHEIGVGKLQPYVRFTSIRPDYSALREEFEYGINYVISGHNARISMYARYGDLESKGGGSFTSAANAGKVNSFNVAMQLQY